MIAISDVVTVYVGSDEANCPACHDGFLCRLSGECVARNATCDRVLDCKDRSDETECAYWTAT